MYRFKTCTIKTFASNYSELHSNIQWFKIVRKAIRVFLEITFSAQPEFLILKMTQAKKKLSGSWHKIHFKDLVSISGWHSWMSEVAKDLSFSR